MAIFGLKLPNFFPNFFRTFSELFSELFRENFASFGKSSKNSSQLETGKKSITETRENENFGKNCLSQGLVKSAPAKKCNFVQF